MALRAKLYKFMGQEGMHSFEGSRGVRNFTKVIEAIGYRNREEFFEDNPGAFEALINFIANSNVPEWETKLNQFIIDEEDELQENE